MIDETSKQIEQRLQDALSIEQLEIINKSAEHVGHPGARAGGGHYQLNIKSAELSKLPVVEAHRKIYTALGDLMKSKIHALTIYL